MACVFDRVFETIQKHLNFHLPLPFRRNGEIDFYWVSGRSNVCGSNYLSRLLRGSSLSLSASSDPLIEILVPREREREGERKRIDVDRRRLNFLCNVSLAV